VRVELPEPEMEETDRSWSLKKLAADGAQRELLMQWEPDRGPMVVLTVYWDTEHCLIPLDRFEARALIAWLEQHVGRVDPPT
jgi:hypothetical protein